MPNPVVQSGLMMCTFGAAPASIIPTSVPTVTEDQLAAATIMDFTPMENIPTFGMCMSAANPQVAAATAAAMGVLTPMPCIPATTAPWTPGSSLVTINNFPMLLNTDTCICTWGGVISITFAGQVTISADM